MADDHAKRALEMLEDVRAEQGTERGLRIAEAQVYATLALLEVLTPVREPIQPYHLDPMNTGPPDDLRSRP